MKVIAAGLMCTLAIASSALLFVSSVDDEWKGGVCLMMLTFGSLTIFSVTAAFGDNDPEGRAERELQSQWQRAIVSPSGAR